MKRGNSVACADIALEYAELNAKRALLGACLRDVPDRSLRATLAYLGQSRAGPRSATRFGRRLRLDYASCRTARSVGVRTVGLAPPTLTYVHRQRRGCDVDQGLEPVGLLPATGRVWSLCSVGFQSFAGGAEGPSSLTGGG
jgi:hypothetical protein